jgi:stearoyl-CoA desaturase (delta-9 desaturase)
MRALSTTQKFRLLHLFTHTATIIGLIWLVLTGNYAWLILSFVAFLFAGIFGVNIALHRYFSHSSFKTNKFWDWFLLISSFFPMLGSPAAWGSVHVYHHIHSDTDKDPHSPKNAGKFGSWFTLWPEMKIPLSIFKHFARDKRILFLHRHYFKLIVAYVVALGIINPLLIPFLFAIPAVGCFHGAAAIAVLPHLNIGGYRNHNTTDNSHNNVLAWILSLGEGWHNNHHHNSRNYRHGEKWWEIDPSAFIIKHFIKTK